MNEQQKTGALRKELLLVRSTLYRAQLQQQSQQLRDPALWLRQGVGMGAEWVAASGARSVVFNLLIQSLGRGRMGRFLKVASGALLAAKLGLMAADWWRNRPR
ncbi:MAG: hypothetical protein JNM52_11525 [Betaproteobacteria bacterium]|nr:hypothetical protein [Betaproteobacteria bacterium]